MSTEDTIKVIQIIANLKVAPLSLNPDVKMLGKGQNYENHNVENQKEHQKSWRRSLHRKDL